MGSMEKSIWNRKACQEMANACVAQAADDYRCATKILQEWGCIETDASKFAGAPDGTLKHIVYKAINDRNSVLTFFASTRFKQFTDVDPSYILKKLNDELGIIEKKVKDPAAGNKKR